MGTVTSLSHRLAWPHLKTLGELVDLARDVPEAEIMPRVIQQLHEIVRLHKSEGVGSPAMLRQAIVTGVLVNRICFDLHGVPRPMMRSQPIAPAAAARARPVGLCLGFRLAPHLYLSVPLTHGRRCLAHNGHQGRRAERAGRPGGRHQIAAARGGTFALIIVSRFSLRVFHTARAKVDDMAKAAGASLLHSIAPAVLPDQLGSTGGRALSRYVRKD